LEKSKTKGREEKIMKTGKFFEALFLLIFVFATGLTFAQDQGKITNLENQIISLKTDIEKIADFENLTDEFFKNNKYNEYADYLKGLLEKKKELKPIVDYYLALTRYQQLKHLESTQNWNEYFDKGNDYRAQVEALTKATIDATSTASSINIYSRLLLWKLNKDQDNSAQENILEQLMKAIEEYSKQTQDSATIKNIADTFQNYGEKLKAKELYKIYVGKLVVAKTDNTQLEAAAAAFYKDGNLELSEEIYNAYIENLIKEGKKEKIIQNLSQIARQFSYQSQGLKDLNFAEKVFKRLEEAAGKDVFDPDLMYSRAYNLEKIKDYILSREIYVDLAKRFPNFSNIDKVNYKIGYIDIYVLRDLKSGKEIFEKLGARDTVNAATISSLYQLGLLSQWENQDKEEAKKYFNKLIEVSNGSYQDKVSLAKERLNEIETSQPVEYNLKTFLDVSLKNENKYFDMTKADLRSVPYQLKVNENINISSSAQNNDSGCMQPELQYLWSGDLGSAKVEINQGSFETKYQDQGVKEINLVVVSPGGILDRNIDLTDVD